MTVGNRFLLTLIQIAASLQITKTLTVKLCAYLTSTTCP